MSHNKALTALLDEVRGIAEGAQSEESLRPAFAKLKEFKATHGAIAYDNSAKWITLGVLALIGALAALAYFYAPGLSSFIEEELGGWAVGTMVVYGIVCAGILIAIGVSDSAIDEISQSMFWKDVCMDNRLSEVNISGKERTLYHRYCADFCDFRDRGDESQYITRKMRGVFQGENGETPYEYYVFHYVVVTYVPVTETYTDAQGKTHTRTVMKRVETTHYRYGIVTDFPDVKGVAAISGGGNWDYPVEWEPTSTEFSGIFTAYADDRMAAAKFWKPAVVLAAIAFGRQFDDPNIEVNRDGKLCVSFDDSDLLHLDRTSSIAAPEEFEREIFSKLELPKLKALMRFVDTARKFNDRNF